MPRRAQVPGARRRVIAGLILCAFALAVAGAAATGWWYARESPAHQGPIVLISVEGVPATALPAYGAQRTDTPSLDRLAADGIVFDRAYAHSPQTLPAHASLLTGQLPIEHGVRDDAGFTLAGEIRTLAEMLRSRGFRTGAAVSSFLLRPASGFAQGFTFFDAELPETPGDAGAALQRSGSLTVDAAERWVRAQSGQRFFLFVQLPRDDVELAVTRLVGVLRARQLYDEATIVLVGDRGDPSAGLALDDATLRVPLLVKQPRGEGAGRRVAVPVQQIDLAPTILDLVRAPVAGSLRGRSLRPVLASRDGVVPDQPVYSESLAAMYRFGGHPLFALTSAHFRYVRGAAEDFVALGPRQEGPGGGGASTEAGRLQRELDRLLAGAPVHRPAPVAARDEERLALFGYLGSPRLPAMTPVVGAAHQTALAEQHREAARLIGQKRYSAGIRALQRIARDHPDLAAVQYQLGVLLMRTGRVEEALEAFRTARQLHPDAAELAITLADALTRAGDADLARAEAEEAIALAHDEDAGTRAAAHEMAARVALAGGDAELAATHATAAEEADATRPIEPFVRGRLLYEQGEYVQAAEAFEEAVARLGDGPAALADLHHYLGASLAQLDRYAEAEEQYRRELRAFPHNLQTYASLAMLYRASNRDEEVEDVLNDLVSGTPTPEGYAVAARLWTILGDPLRAEAVRSDARARFRGDPLPALAPGARR